jgi:LacI family transcriptional regulator
MSAKRTPTITIRDVAARADVALSSVSRVLNGHPAVSDSLRERVQRAVAELDYQPDFTATNLRRGSTMTIAFLVRDIASPLFADVVKAVETRLGAVNYSVLLMNSAGDPVREAANLRALARSRVDGVILSLSSESDADTLAAVRALRSPIVLLDRAIAGLEASTVASDHVIGLSAATEHLTRRGHTRIALITGPRDVLASRERERGYRAGLRAAGLPDDPDLVRMEGYDEESARRQAAAVLSLDEPATAIIAGGGTISYGVLRALTDAGAVDAVELVVCDPWRSPELFEPRVSVVCRDAAELGAAAADLMLEAITEGTHRSVILPTELVPGN